MSQAENYFFKKADPLHVYKTIRKLNSQPGGRKIAMPKAARHEGWRNFVNTDVFNRAATNPIGMASRGHVEKLIRNSGMNEAKQERELSLFELSKNIQEQNNQNQIKFNKQQKKYKAKEEAEKDWYSRTVQPKISGFFSDVGDTIARDWETNKKFIGWGKDTTNDGLRKIGIEDEVRSTNEFLGKHVGGNTSKYVGKPVGKATGITVKTAIDTISRPFYGVANTQLTAAKNESKGQSWWDKHAGFAGKLIPGVGPLLDPMFYGGVSPLSTLDDYGKNPKQLKKLPKAFTDGFWGSDNKKTTGYDLLDYNASNDGKKNFYDSTTYKAVGGLAHDVVYDPLSYVGVGAIRSGATAASRATTATRRSVEANRNYDRLRQTVNGLAKPVFDKGYGLDSVRKRLDAREASRLVGAQRTADYARGNLQFNADAANAALRAEADGAVSLSGDSVRSALVDHGRHMSRQLDGGSYTREVAKIVRENKKLGADQQLAVPSLDAWKSEFKNIDDSPLGDLFKAEKAFDATPTSEAVRPSTVLADVKKDLMRNNPTYRKQNLAKKRADRGLNGRKVRKSDAKGVKDKKATRDYSTGVNSRLNELEKLGLKRTPEQYQELGRLRAIKRSLEEDRKRALNIINRLESQSMSKAVQVRLAAAQGVKRAPEDEFIDPDRARYLKDLIENLRNADDTQGIAGAGASLDQSRRIDSMFDRADEVDNLAGTSADDFLNPSTQGIAGDINEFLPRRSGNISDINTKYASGYSANDIVNSSSVAAKRLEEQALSQARKRGDNPNFLAEERAIEAQLAKAEGEEALEASFKVGKSSKDHTVVLGDMVTHLDDIIASGSVDKIIAAASKELDRLTTPVGKIELESLAIPRVFLNTKGDITVETVSKIVDDLTMWVDDTQRMIIRGTAIDKAFPTSAVEVREFLTHVVEAANLSKFDDEALALISKNMEKTLKPSSAPNKTTKELLEGITPEPRVAPKKTILDEIRKTSFDDFADKLPPNVPLKEPKIKKPSFEEIRGNAPKSSKKPFVFPRAAEQTMEESIAASAKAKEALIGTLKADIAYILKGTEGRTKEFSIADTPVKLSVTDLNKKIAANQAKVEKGVEAVFRKEHERIVAELKASKDGQIMQRLRREHAALKVEQKRMRADLAAARVELENTAKAAEKMDAESSIISNILKGEYGERHVGVSLRMLTKQWELPGSASMIAAARYTFDLPVLNIPTMAYRKGLKPIAAHPEAYHLIAARNLNKPNIVIKTHADILHKNFKNYTVAEREAARKTSFNQNKVIGFTPAEIAVREEYYKLLPFLQGNAVVEGQELTLNEIMRNVPEELIMSAEARATDITLDNLDDLLSTGLIPRQARIREDYRVKMGLHMDGGLDSVQHAKALDAYIKKNGTPEDKATLAKTIPTDPFEIALNMHIAIEKAIGYKGLQSDVNSLFGIKAIKKEFTAKNGKTYLTKEYKANHTTYEQIERLKSEGWETIEGLGSTHIYPPEHLNDIKRLLEMFDPRNVGKVMKGFDQITTHWKVAATIYNPGYYTRNLIGEVLSGWMGGVNNPLYYKRSGEWSKHMRSIPDDELPFMLEYKVHDGYKEWKHNDTSPVVARRNGEDLSIVHVEALWKDQAIDTSFLNDEFQQQLLRTPEYRAKGNKVTGKAKDIHEKVQRLGENAENYPRKAHFLHALEHAPAKMNLDEAAAYAAEQVRTYHFDYSDITNFEKTVMMRAIPFYKWTRKAVPLIVSTYLTNPGKITAVPKAMAAASTIGMGGNDHLDGIMGSYDESVPSWIKDMGAYPFGSDSEGKTTFGNVITPQIDGLKALFNPVGTAQLMANPIAKIPAELVVGKNFNTNVDGPGGEFRNWEDRLKHAMGIIPATKFAGKMSRLGASDTAESPYGEPGALMDERVFNFATGLGAYEDPGFKKFDMKAFRATAENSNKDGTFNIDKYFRDNPEGWKAEKYRDRKSMVNDAGYIDAEFYKKYPGDLTPEIEKNLYRTKMADPKNNNYPKPAFYKRYPEEMSPGLVKFYQYQGILDANGNFTS